MALEPIGKTVIQVGLDDTKVTDGLTKLNAKMKMADNAWKSSLSTFKQSDRSIEKLGVSLKGMNDKLKVQQTIVAAHEKKVEKLAAEYGNTHTKVIKATAELEKQRATMGNLQRSVGEVTKELQDLQKAEQLSKSPWVQRQKELQAYSDKMSALGERAMGMGQNMSMAVTAPIVGLGAASVKVAGEYSAAESQFKTVFGNMQKEAKASLDAISKETGLLPNSLRGTYTQMAAFAKTTGASTKDAMDLTSRATMAAADSAAFYDRSISEVSENLQSFLKGNYENDAALGISATETTRNAKANELYGKSFAELSEQQKQLTLLKMVEDGNKLAGAMGQAAREQDQLGTQTANLKTAWADFQNEVGKPLLPIAIDALKGLSTTAKDAANWFNGLGDGSKKLVLGIGGIAAAAGPSLIAFGMMAKGVGAVAGAYSKLSGPLKLFTKGAETAGKATGMFARSSGLLSRGLGLLGGPVGIALTAVTALYGGFKLAYKHVDWFREGVDNTGKLLKEVAGTVNFQWAKDMGTTFKIGAGYARDMAGGLGGILKKGIEFTPYGAAAKAAFGIVNDAVSKATDKIDIYGKGVSKGTEKALKGYTDLSQKARLQLEILRSSHKTIGDKQYQEIVSLYDKMTNTAVNKIQQRRSREMSGLRKLFADTKGLRASEENKILTEAQAGNNKEVQAVKSIQRQISAIYSKAHKEKRALTNIEESKLVILQQKMDQKVVSSLSKSEKEQRIILGRLRDNKKALSIQAASEVIKASAKERDKTISDAKKKKKGIIDEAIYQRDVTKKISKEQADKIIKDAERQYKGSVKNAKEQHKKVVDEAARQNKGVKREIDSQTGHVLSKWQKLKRQTGPILTGIKVATVKSYEDAKKGVAKWIGQTALDTLKRWNGIKKSTIGVTESIRKSTVKKYEDLKSGTVKWLGVASTQMSSKWGSIKKNTTSLAEGVRKVAVDKFEQMYKKSTGWVTSIGTFIDKAKSGISAKASRLGESISKAAIGGLNKMIDGVNWVANKLGMDKLPHIKYSTGTIGKKPLYDTRSGGHPGGLATVADKGPGNGKGVRELVQFPDGRTALFEKETTFNMPKGTHVYSNKETEPILKGIKYSTGTKKKNLVEQIGDAANWTKHTAYGVAAKTGANAFTNSSKLVGGKKTANALKSTAKVGESVEDIMKYAADPNKLVDFILKKFGVDFSSIKALPKQILDSQFKKIKKGVADKFSEWFAAQDGGEGGDGRYIDLSHGINFGFMPSAAQAMAAGYPFPRRHLGLDIDYPYGTKVYSTVSGTATGASGWNGGFGQNVTIKSGILEVIFGHLSKLAFQGTKQVKPGDFLGLSGGDPARQGVNAGSSSGAHLHYEMRKNGVAFDPTNWLKQNNGVRKGASSGPSGVSGNASSWASVIRKAAAQMNERITNADVNAIVAQIHRESGGNQTIVQGNIGDINNLRGTPARGLLQYVPSTFANYAVKGHTNINSGYDQLLAFFNNRNWRANNPAGRSGWSPNGARKYADGGIIKKPHYGLVGEDGPEAIIPLDPKKKTRAQQLLAYANGVVNKDGRKYVKEPPKTHTVKSGDTLWGISQANKMTVSMLKELNNLKSNLIFPKQILKLNTGAYKLVGAIKEHASAIKQSITKKPTTVKPKVQMTSVTGVISKFADGLIRSGTIFKDLKTSKTDLSFGKFLESKLKGLNSSNIKTVMTNVSDIKKKLTEIDKKNDKLIKTNNTKIKSATVKNFDEQLKIDNYKAEKALNGKKGTITVKTRIAARDTTLIDRNLAKSKLNKAAHEKDLKTLHAYEDKLLKKRATLKTKKEKENNAKLLASTKKRIADEQKQRDKEVANIKKYEAQRADALKLKYKTEKKYVTGRSASALDKLINTSTNNIGKNNTLIKNLKSENTLYAKQTATLKKIKGAEILKSDVLKKIAARREQLVKMMEALKKKETSLKEEKQSFADSISENLQSYAGFGGARGHTARDFVSWMRYRLGKMRTFASNVQKLKGMGLDPKLIREMLAGGIENAIPKVEALVKGGGGYISQINSLQKEIDGVVKSISTEQSTSLFADELASNKRRQDVVTKAMKDNEARLDKFRSGKDKVISMKSYTDLENKTSKYKYQAKALSKKTTASKTTATSGKYKVKSGDSLWLIANKYKTTVDNLKKLNGLKSNLIHPNQTLKVPGVAKSQKVVNLEAAKKKREDESTKLIVNTAKKLNAVGKNDKYAAQLQKEIADIRKSTTKKDDALVAKLEKEMKENKALTKEMVNLLSQILNKPTNVILDGQKVSKTVEKNIVTKAKTTARKTVTPKPKTKTPVRRKA